MKFVENKKSEDALDIDVQTVPTGCVCIDGSIGRGRFSRTNFSYTFKKIKRT